MRSRKWLVLMAAVVVVGALCAAGWLTLRDRGLPPAERLRVALDCLGQTDKPQLLKKAETIARGLERLKYRDPKFPAATKFILGMAAFRDAEGRGIFRSDPQYATAARYLREADQRILDESWRPQWAYALGVSLLRMGEATEARPLLEKAADTFAAGRVGASMLLSDVYLDLNSRPEIEAALRLNDWLLQQEGLTPSDRDRICLQRVLAYQSLGLEPEAQTALEQMSEEASKQQGAALMSAQDLMATGKHDQALTLLESLTGSTVLNEYFARQALFRMGLCAERLAEMSSDEETRKSRIDAAVGYYEGTSQRFPESHESVAADLRVADLLHAYRPTARNEEALERYRRALRTVKKGEDFRNRWISRDAFQQSILRAWNEWLAAHAYEHAVALTQALVPLFANSVASELMGRAHQYWAEHLVATLDAAPNAQRPAMQQQARSHWRASGRAFAELAEQLAVSPKSAELILTSAEHYYRGHDYQKALPQIEKFIARQQTTYLPAALVRQGEILMHLGRHAEASDRFLRIIEQFPTDPACFRAQYLIGQCHLEQNQVKEAEQSWRDVVSSESLTPAAQEWRLALFSLGRLLYHRAELQRRERQQKGDVQPSLPTQSPQPAQQNHSTPQTQPTRAEGDTELALWDEAIARLDEFLQRYPQSPESGEAAYLLAQALARGARLLRVQRTSTEADNSRLELKRREDERLRAALTQFRAVEAYLSPRQQRDQLDSFGQRALKDSYFEIARSHLELEEFEQAIAAYRNAIYKYPDDPQVLLAYIQMAHCFTRLGKPAESQSLLEQAKVILRDLPEGVFQATSTIVQSKDWARWLDWVGQVQRFAESDSTNTSVVQ